MSRCRLNATRRRYPDILQSERPRRLLDESDRRMSFALDLTPEEQVSLQRLLGGLTRDPGRPASLNDMLSRWRAFVHAVERGYDDSIYEYMNDLLVRDHLEALLTAAPPGLRSKLENAISPIDSRFMKATEQAALSQAGGELVSWWHRVGSSGRLAQSGSTRPGPPLRSSQRGATRGSARANAPRRAGACADLCGPRAPLVRARRSG